MQAAPVSETPSAWLTLFDLPWRLHLTQLIGSPKLLFHLNGCSWLMLHNFLNSIKQSTAGLSKLLALISLLSDPDPALAAVSLDSHLSFAWESPSQAQVAAISDCFIAQAGWPQAKHRWGLTLTCTTQENPGPDTDHIRAPPPCPCTADPP